MLMIGIIRPMDLLSASILGFVQGLTEFIPVSSSGHLVLLQQVLTGASDHRFLEFINIGTFLALVVYFRVKIAVIVKDVFVHKNYSLARNIIITSVPAGIIGFVLSDFISNNPFFGSVVVVLSALAVVGALMVMIEYVPRLSPLKSGATLTWRRALGIGVAQVGALIPGVSRSGSTMIAGRIAGLSSAQAAEYSFLASLPIMFAVTLQLCIKPSDRAYFVEHLPGLLVGNLVAFVTGMIAIGFLLRYLANHDMRLFGWYRIGLVAVVVVVLLVQ